MLCSESYDFSDDNKIDQIFQDLVRQIRDSKGPYGRKSTSSSGKRSNSGKVAPVIPKFSLSGKLDKKESNKSATNTNSSATEKEEKERIQEEEYRRQREMNKDVRAIFQIVQLLATPSSFSTTIVELDLSSNVERLLGKVANIGDGGAKALANVLKYNRTMKSLNLQGIIRSWYCSVFSLFWLFAL
jgi:hypothetical protein